VRRRNGEKDNVGEFALWSWREKGGILGIAKKRKGHPMREKERRGEGIFFGSQNPRTIGGGGRGALNCFFREGGKKTLHVPCFAKKREQESKKKGGRRKPINGRFLGGGGGGRGNHAARLLRRGRGVNREEESVLTFQKWKEEKKTRHANRISYIERGKREERRGSEGERKRKKGFLDRKDTV